MSKPTTIQYLGATYTIQYVTYANGLTGIELNSARHNTIIVTEYLPHMPLTKGECWIDESNPMIPRHELLDAGVITELYEQHREGYTTYGKYKIVGGSDE